MNFYHSQQGGGGGGGSVEGAAGEGGNEEVCGGDKFAPCPLCNLVIFDAKKNMIKHFNKFHYDKKNKSFLCSICTNQFEDPQLLIAHVKVHFEATEEEQEQEEEGV